ncbi:protein EXORDIUM-like 2 [Telopea speciosissima]|uniref:protein EXORDIUM-like 2 n=1 Tax=Telopea speciosissima TaxID=54955 RepID=UPI001CC7DD31|nr:protein EXORDIUM-like 2 [Telopea speciosissima]
MASSHQYSFLLVSLILILSSLVVPSTAIATARKLSLVQQQPLVLSYHNGPLLKGNITVHITWYGKFTPSQRAILIDFIQSLRVLIPAPSVSSWWKMTEEYKRGFTNLIVGKQTIDETYSLGKSLKYPHILRFARRGDHQGAISVIFTAKDVLVDGFCMNNCGSHGTGKASRTSKTKFPYIWVGNPETQCPGECAWPFYQPIYGPQTPPLIAPNGDIGVDGMIINFATLLAGTVTNPFDNGYYQGPSNAPLEAVSACTGIYGKGAYPGYPGELLVDKTTGASYNAVGIHGRKYLLPAMWDPKTSACSTLV